MKRKQLAVLGIGFLLCLMPLSAGAISIDFSPVSQTVGPADTVLVDIVISDLAGEIVSAYDLDVTFDPTILSATDVSFGSFLGDEAFFEVFSHFDLSAAGVVDFAQLSLLSDLDLALQQPDAFVLATLEFEAIGLGTSALDFVFDVFNDLKGTGAQVLNVTAGSGSVTGTVVVPEPHAALLFALGTWVIGTAIRRRPRAG